jgi:hypothetical protein
VALLPHQPIDDGAGILPRLVGVPSEFAPRGPFTEDRVANEPLPADVLDAKRQSEAAGDIPASGWLDDNPGLS